MDAIEADELAACLEFRLGAGAADARVECYAVPCRRGSTRRRSPWVFLLVTDLGDKEVHDGLEGFHVETICRRGNVKTYAAWPPGGGGTV